MFSHEANAAGSLKVEVQACQHINIHIYLCEGIKLNTLVQSVDDCVGRGDFAVLHIRSCTADFTQL
jgi:hypothetical protein